VVRCRYHHLKKTKDERNQLQMTDNLLKICRPGRRPVRQGPRPLLSNRGWVEMSATGTDKKFKVANEIWNMDRANTVEYWKVGIITQGDGCIQLRHFGIIGDEMDWQRRDEWWGSYLVWRGQKPL